MLFHMLEPEAPAFKLNCVINLGASPNVHPYFPFYQDILIKSMAPPSAAILVVAL